MDLLRATRSLQILSTAAGLWPQRAMAGVIWSVVILCLVLTGLVYSFVHYVLYVYPCNTPYMISADILSRLMLYGTSTTCLLGPLLLHRGAVLRILRLIARVDSRISPDSSPANIRTRKLLTFVLIVLVVIVIAFFCFHETVYGVGINFYFILFDELAHFIILVSDVQFVTIAMLLKSRWQKLNKNLCAFLRKRYSGEIRLYREMCSELHDICWLVNQVYGFPIFMEFTCTLISVVSTFNNMMLHLKNVLKLRRAIGSGTTLCHILWLLFYIGKFLGITTSSHGATSESAKSESLVQKLLLRRFLPMDVAEELQAFSVQLCSHRLQFTASGFFSLNLSLLPGIVGAAATYIIILLQFT